MSVMRSRSRGIGSPAGAPPLSLLTSVSMRSDTDRLLPVHVLERRTDAVRDRRERGHVDAVDAGGVLAEDLAGLVLGNLSEPLGDPVTGVGVGPLGMGEVVAPQQVADADLVAAGDLVDPGGGRREEA